MKRVLYILFAMATATLYSCDSPNAEDCVKTNGTVEKFHKVLPTSVNSINVDDNVEIVLLDSLAGELILETGKNLEPKITFTQEDSILIIRNKNTCEWMRSYDVPLKVYVGINQIRKIESYGYGKIASAEKLTGTKLLLYSYDKSDIDVDFDGQHLSFMCFVSGNARIRGTTDELFGILAQYANLESREASTRHLYLQTTSMNDLYAASAETLQVFFQFKRDVYYRGTPTSIIAQGNPDDIGAIKPE